MKQIWEERWSSVWGKVSMRLFHAPANIQSGQWEIKDRRGPNSQSPWYIKGC